MYKTINLPTPANKIVTDFVEEISRIKPSFVDGIYLTGSLPMNDFYSNKSDIDFIVLCKSLPDKKTFSQLQCIHKKMAKRFNKPDLSGSYLTSISLLANPTTSIKTLSFHEGALRYGTFEMAPVSLAELKSNAITILGQKAEALQIDINQDDLNSFLYNNMNSYWKKWVDQHSSYFNRKLLLLLFPRFTEWSVLGVARQLCTLHTGRIVSKTEAGLYCLQQLPDKFHSIIKEALEIRKDNRTYPMVKSYTVRPSFRRLSQTINCVNYIISTFNSAYNGIDNNHQRYIGKSKAATNGSYQ